VGLSFHWDVYGIEKMVGEKMASSSFGGAIGLRLQTLGNKTGKPWVPTRQVGLQATICRQMVLRLP